MDYQLSSKFGLDWKKYSYKRLRYFYEIMKLEYKKEEIEYSKIKSKNLKYGYRK